MKRARSSWRKSKEAQWRLDWTRITAWRTWDGESVLYDDLSGDTLKLDVVMTEIFVRLQKDNATAEELVQHLARLLELEADRRVEHLVEIAIQRLARSGLIESADARPKAAGMP